MINMPGWALFATCIIIFASCTGRAVYHQAHSIDDNTWGKAHKLVFEAEVDDTLALHELYLDIRNTTDYEYSNLYLFLDIEFPGGRVVRDTIECILAERDGSWTGKGIGRIRSNRFLFRDDVWFPEAGTYSFTVTHGMRYDTLREISDVGLRIERK